MHYEKLYGLSSNDFSQTIMRERMVKYGTIFKLESCVKKIRIGNKRGLLNVFINLNTVRSDIWRLEEIIRTSR